MLAKTAKTDSAKIDPDSDLIIRLQAGDETALSELMSRRMNTVHGLAARMLGDSVMAEDVTQTVFLKTWAHIGKWEAGKAKLLTWMCRVATNQCLDILKRKGPIYSDNVPDVADKRSTAFEQLHQDDEAARVRAAINTLPPRQHAAITLCYFQELSQREAAEVLEISEKAYESLLSRGRKKLRGTLIKTKQDNIGNAV